MSDPGSSDRIWFEFLSGIESRSVPSCVVERVDLVRWAGNPTETAMYCKAATSSSVTLCCIFYGERVNLLICLGDPRPKLMGNSDYLNDRSDTVTRMWIETQLKLSSLKIGMINKFDRQL